MKRSTILLLLIMQVIFLGGCLSFYDPKPACRVEGERIIFRFDLRWNEEKRMEVAARYELDSAVVKAAYMLVPEIKTDSTVWTIKKRNRYFVEFSKPVMSTNISFFEKNDVFMIDDGWVRRDEVSEKKDVIFGINDLRRETAFGYSDSLATFFLRNHETAEEVYLSGSFNDWSTMGIPMKKVDGGWNAMVRLDPGKYTYKYIVDGKWLNDPDNLRKERENARGLVSVIYCTNRVFRFDENGQKRSRVMLTGNFINWDRSGIPMRKSGDSWILPMYLRDGTYAYKFIADNDWLTDPANKDTRSDADGNLNSFLSIGKSQKFFLEGHTDAEKVILSGTFNNWSGNELVMNRTVKGWELDYAIPSGIYEYKYLVDGRWMPDPLNPFTTGTGDYTNSVLVVKPTYTFILDNHKDANSVIITGNFSSWSPDKYRMVKRADRWEFPVYLPPGKYLYKFIVDGKWILDPANDLWEENEWGSGNSILWVGR
jgi:1,4-alpha-glucan branching enzyme